ncbi:hypothetical protein AB0C84_39715 [Actinomadura sp. NPDC048955]|uniref:hypothetical protein n=1 Tax=Actinomadura sp. NPDC048955 TaxID=3158228 RepID=UPI0033CBF477
MGARAYPHGRAPNVPRAPRRSPPAIIGSTARDRIRYSADPVADHGARGLARGTLHAADGALVASVAQEALLRPASP